jgi:hypothetical protein
VNLPSPAGDWDVPELDHGLNPIGLGNSKRKLRRKTKIIKKNDQQT